MSTMEPAALSDLPQPVELLAFTEPDFNNLHYWPRFLTPSNSQVSRTSDFIWLYSTHLIRWLQPESWWLFVLTNGHLSSVPLTAPLFHFQRGPTSSGMTRSSILVCKYRSLDRYLPLRHQTRHYNVH